MRAFEYARPRTIDELLPLLRPDGKDGAGLVRPLAGGTDLLTLMKGEVVEPARLFDIKRLSELDGGLRPTADGLTLGALVTLAEIEHDARVAERYPALAQAVALAATPQLRNMATIGGNLLQRPRCWYYRNRNLTCWLKGGEDCPARDGENQYHALFGTSPCVAVHPSDPAAALLALGAEVRLRGPAGERTLPLDELFAEPTEARRTETVLAPDELLIAVHLPAPAPGSRSAYLKAMDRKVWAFALVGVAAAIRQENGRIASARLVLSGVATIPWRAAAAEELLLGAEPSPALFDRAAEAALSGATPLAHNRYKLPLARSLVKQALAGASG